MSRGTRVIEYVLVAGLVQKTDEGRQSSPSPRRDVSQGPTYSGAILQRFPATDRKTTPLPRGIEIFCQPLGWTLTTTPSPPSLTTFILTAEDGKRLFCSSLTFHQLESQSKRAKKRMLSAPAEPDAASITEIHRQVARFKSSPSFDCLDEGLEANWSPEAIVNNPHELFQPVSICLVSRLPLFDILQSCLKGLYLNWLTQSSPLEETVAQFLTSFTLPPLNCLQIRRPIGHLGDIVLPPIHEESSLPYTSTGALKLLQSIGVHNMIHLLSTLLCDVSVLFISSSFTALTSAVHTVCSLLHPFQLSHSLVPVVPGELLEMVQLPSIYIMGLHTSLRRKVEELGDVVELNLDDGRMTTPPSVSIPLLPPATLEPVHRALARIVNPSIEYRDMLFGATHSTQKSPELQDKEVRAVFLCLLVSFLGDYQQFVTVLRFHPRPSFAFNKEAYLQSHSIEDSHSLLHKIVDGIPLMDFVHSRSLPFRKCDHFDELAARYAESPEMFGPEYLYSQQHISDMADELLQLLPPTASGAEQFKTGNLTPQQIAHPSKVFPQLREKKVEQVMQLLSGKEEEEEEEEEEGREGEDELRGVPFLETQQENTDKNTSPNFQRDLEALRSCLDMLFQSKVIEARKYIPMVTQALKQRSLVRSLVPELVQRVMQVNSVVLSSDQFDILVKIINSSVTDDKTAMALLPVSTIMYREINPGVHQHVCTHLQHHSIWTKLDFWKSALYSAVQAELVRIYAEHELTNQNKAPPKTGPPRRVTVGDSPEDNIVLGEPLEPEIGEITLRSRQRLRSSDPTALRAMRRTALSKSMRMRMRASVVLPGVSEGVLPPNAEPVTAQEAMHHLAKQLRRWPTLTEKEQTRLTQQEENAVQNQLILFVQRILQLRIPVEYSGYEEREALKEDLLDFISRFLRMVELELNFEFNRHGKIRGQMKDMIQIHMDSLKGLREELKRRPLAKIKAKAIKPPLLEGETTISYGIHCYLLADGRENGLLVPADGHVFVTSYRVIYIGTPCNPQAPNVIVTRSFPVATIFRIKRLPPSPITQLATMTTSGLQIRTVTAELLRIGFDDDTNPQDVKLLIQIIVDLCNPTKITRGLKPAPPPSPVASDPCGICSGTFSSSLTASQLISSTTRIKNTKNNNRGFEQSNILSTSDTLTRVKQISDLSRSPCCQEYERMGLGSLNFSASNKGPWKITALNMTYAVCNSYPAVVVVPESTTDETLISVSSQFQNNRFPVVTWKRPNNQAVLLRSGCFVPGAAPPKFGPLGNLPTAVLPAKNKLIGVAGKFAGVGNKEKVAHPQANGGTGVFNIDVEGYMLDILHLSQSYRRKRQKNNLLSEISGAPETMHFDLPERTSSKHGRRRRPSKKGARAKSWESDDIDFSRRQHFRNGESSERSLTPEPHLDRILSSPEAVGKKRRFTISNVMQKVRSPHIGRRKRYRVAKNSGDIVLENPVSPLHGEREEEEEGFVKKAIKTMLIKGGGGEEGREKGGKAILEEGEETMEQKEEKGEKKEDATVANHHPQRESSILTSSGQESVDLGEAMRERGLDDLGAMSPTQGIPKLLSLRRGSSTPDLLERSVARGDGVARGDTEGIDLEEIEMRERHEASLSPELGGEEEEEEERRKSAIDWERVGGEGGGAVPGETTPSDMESRPSTSTPDLMSGSGSRLDMDQVWASPQKHAEGPGGQVWDVNSPDFEGSPAMFSILPTNPRDWITVDALPAQLHHWHDSALYIIGDKQALRDVSDDLFPNCTFVPVEVPTPSDVSQSFKKLMRACAPSHTNTAYLTAVEESGWMTQLSTVLEVSVAVADLIHIQESSVLVCLENGWDATAQVVSLAQILLDPYYRTIEGFQALVEKDWLSFGHRFSQNGNHTTSSNISGFTPIFLQFLDLVHQMLHQFPLSFEFSDFYLRMMAYHHSSMRFHTFTLNTEKERYANNWLPYRPRHANVHGSSSQTEPYVAYWSYIDSLHSELTILYNFKYKPNENTGPLCPHSYQANLDLWCFYLDNHLSQFPPYDTEFLSESDLTPVDLHYNFFEKEKSLASGQKGAGFSGVNLATGISGIGTLLLEYTALINLHGQKKGLPSATWRELWEELQDSVGKSASPLLPVQPSERLMLSHGQAMHKRTTMAVLIKGKLAVELEDQMTYPHNFVSASLTGPRECEFCKHTVNVKRAYKCSSCGSVCHEHCKSKVPFNCGHKHDIAQKKKKSPIFPERTVRLDRTPSSVSHLVGGLGGASSPQLDAATMDGVLLKRGKIVKSWKSRYFVLNPEKRELCYYDSKKKEKCHGTITLTDEDSVEQADPQIVPGLKQNENGFFFNLITSKRTYYLMARSNNERAEWMVRIKNALPITTV